MDKKKCEGLLTEKECLEAFKSMESGKSAVTFSLPNFIKFSGKIYLLSSQVPLIEAIKKEN